MIQLLSLKRYSKLLKPEGKIIILTPNTQSIAHCLFGFYWRGLEPPRHIHLFNSNNLKVCLQKSGFLALEQKSFSADSHKIYLWGFIQKYHAESLYDYLLALLFQCEEFRSKKICEADGEDLFLVAQKINIL
ncbi:hypothetical protein A946_02060 [Methylacidiphilum kamchatkense Kam1]|uniref:Methyltransferase family protein n=1 Tax=Methylacidiphilum kamchatkense Kam1 TaxID=1202785 RepID=A0ABR5A0F0_9BACT|nr:hypothetical protein A946_02060 [Methylacidiphilum kamchatkense Kam1]